LINLNSLHTTSYELYVFLANTCATDTMYIKNRAFVPNRKVCEFLQSPLNIKFGVYRKKNKSKIFIFS
jgi:hypothetical protein